MTRVSLARSNALTRRLMLGLLSGLFVMPMLGTRSPHPLLEAGQKGPTSRDHLMAPVFVRVFTLIDSVLPLAAVTVPVLFHLFAMIVKAVPAANATVLEVSKLPTPLLTDSPEPPASTLSGP